MKRALSIPVMASVLTYNAPATTTWTVDNVHSSVKFAVSHLVISEVEGSFKMYGGTVRSNGPEFTDADVEFTVDVNSIDTDNGMRDKHLRSDDFFNAEQFPQMSFKSISWRKVEGRRYVVEGEMTIRDVTRRVAFDVMYGGTMKDSYGNVKAGFKATTTINRFDFGLKWNALTEAGGATVGKDVSITLNLELTQQEPS